MLKSLVRRTGFRRFTQSRIVPSAFAEDRNGAVLDWHVEWRPGAVSERALPAIPVLLRRTRARCPRLAASMGRGRLWIGSRRRGLLRVDDPSAGQLRHSPPTPSRAVFRVIPFTRSPKISMDASMPPAAAASTVSIHRGLPAAGDPPLHDRGWFVACEPPSGLPGPAWRAVVWRRPWPAPNRATEGCLSTLPTFWSTPFESMAASASDL